MKKSLTALLIGLTFFLSGCQSNKKVKENSEKIQVVATFYPMYHFAQQILGEEGEVNLLIPAGTEPHDYEPSPKDMIKIHDADAFIYNSDALETWVIKSKEAFGTNVLIIEGAKEISLLESAEKQQDPHVWLSPDLALQEVQTITKVLVEKFPQKRQELEKNSQVYQEKLKELHQNYQKTLEPFKGQTFITQHTAFSYLAAAYGLNQVGVMGLSEGEEPSPKRMLELKKEVADKELTTLFQEENSHNKVMVALQKETGLTLESLATIESVSPEKIKAGEDYLSIMEDNLQKLADSFKK